MPSKLRRGLKTAMAGRNASAWAWAPCAQSLRVSTHKSAKASSR